jgi:ADP-ribose pyrophosphatase YjhB (NUDIX family)
MERWNSYTRDEILTDRVLIRGEQVPDGLYYMACEVLIRHTDGSYLCMKRSVKKKDFGGMYEASAGGAALLGEDKLTCIKREMLEETGLISSDFEEIAHTVDDEKHIIIHSFLTVVNCDKSSVTLQEGETEGYVWLSETEFIEFILSGQMIDRQRARLDGYLRKMGYINNLSEPHFPRECGSLELFSFVISLFAVFCNELSVLF